MGMGVGVGGRKILGVEIFFSIVRCVVDGMGGMDGWMGWMDGWDGWDGWDGDLFGMQKFDVG